MKDTEELKENIWKDYNNGVNTLDISKKYGISRSYCYQVISVKKGRGDNTEKILMDRIEVLEKQLADKTNEIHKLKEETELYKKLLIKLTDN